MKELSKDEVIKSLKKAGNYNNNRLKERIAKANFCYSLKIESPSFLLELVFHYHQNSRILTPTRWWGGGRLYTMAAVLERMQKENLSFKDLSEGAIKGDYLPDFFRPCYDMEKDFSYEKCASLVLCPLNISEKLDCPNAMFRVIDGMHRALTLAYLVKKEPGFWQPIDCFILQ